MYMKRTYVEDLVSHEPTPTERPIEGLHGSVSREEVVSPDVRVLRKRVEALGNDHERGGVVDFVEDDL